VLTFFNSNKADLAMIRSSGIEIADRPKKQVTFKMVAILVRATVRMKKSAEEWRKSRKIQKLLIQKVEEMKKTEKDAAKDALKESVVRVTSKNESSKMPSRNVSMATSKSETSRAERMKRKSRKSSNAY